MSMSPRSRRRPETRPRGARLYFMLGSWHSLAFLGYVLAPLFERRVPWHLVFAHAAGTALSPPLLIIFVAPVTLFLLRVVRTRRKRGPLLDAAWLAGSPRGLGVGRWLLGLGTVAWVATLVVAVVQRWPQGIGIGIGVALLLSGTGILTIEMSERRWRRSSREANAPAHRPPGRSG